MEIGISCKEFWRGRGSGCRKDIRGQSTRLSQHFNIYAELLRCRGDRGGRSRCVQLCRRRAASPPPKLNGTVAQSTLDRGTTVGMRIGGMDETITLVAESVAFRLTVDSGGCIVAMLAKGEGCNSGGEINALMI